MKIFIKTTGWLAMAAALTLGTAACSSSDDSIVEQPVNPTEPKTYTMTVQATKPTGDDAATRARLRLRTATALHARLAERSTMLLRLRVSH